MIHHVPDGILADASRVIDERLGLSFARERWDDLRRKLGAAARELGHADAAACARWIGKGSLAQHHIEVLAWHLTVGETYFYRDQETLGALKHSVLPPLLDARAKTTRRLAIWSAGCSTGEEPYTIAIILRQLLPDIASWNISITGTDINSKALQKAAKGVYSSWSFRRLPASTRDRYFHTLDKGRFAIHPEIRAMVSFDGLNLCEPEYPPHLAQDIDIIVCRNVFLYFSPERLAETLDKLVRCLAPGGWLVVSPVEVPCVRHPRLSVVSEPGTTLFRKDTAGAQAPAAPVRPRIAHPPAAPARHGLAHAHPREPHASHAHAHAPQAIAQPPSVKPGYEDAHELFVRGLYAEAAAALTPESPAAAEPRAAMLLARCHANLGNLAEAMLWSGRAAEADKMQQSVQYLAGLIAYAGQDMKTAEHFLRRALYLDPGFVSAHVAIGNVYRSMGKGKTYVRHYRTAIELLAAMPPDTLVPETEGVNAARLSEILAHAVAREH